MDRLSAFSTDVQTTILYLANPNLSLAVLGEQLGISKQAVQKRVKKGKSILHQTHYKKRIKDLEKAYNDSQKELKRYRELAARLRRQLILYSALIFIFKCFKERVQKFFPNFDVKRFHPYEKKHILELLRKFQTAGGTIKDFCQFINKSELTIRHWAQAYERYGIAGLKDKRTTPRQFSHRMPLWLKEQLLILFMRFPQWSSYRYHQYIKNSPATNTSISIAAIEKLKTISSEKTKTEQERIKKRWAFDENHSVWTVDFTCIVKTNNYKLQLLTVSDHRSRFFFEPIVLLDTSTKQVMAHLEELFLKYGRPFMIKADNGQEFRTYCREQLNKLGVYLFNSPRYYGQFCGAHERIHRTLKNYISNFSEHKNITKLVEELKSLTEEYNYEWPQKYLENKTPAQVFYSEDIFVPKNTEIVRPYEKDGKLCMKFTNRHGKPACMSLPLIDESSTT